VTKRSRKIKEYVHNFWDISSTAEMQCEGSFFMPNGMFISMMVSKFDTMGTIKKKLWQKAVTDGTAKGLEGLSKDYVFTTVDPNAKVVDESVRLIDLKPIFCMFKLKLRNFEKEYSQNERNIKLLVGQKSPSHRVVINRPEVSHRETANGLYSSKSFYSISDQRF
jgi:PI3-kinase family, p85-binding domain